MTPNSLPIRFGQPASAQRGFVLLMALVLVLLAGVALAGIAGRSLSSALHTRTQVQELQRRWAVISLRTTLASRIEELLEHAQRGQAEPAKPDDRPCYDHPPISELRLQVNLAEYVYELVLTDEQAKLNVNHWLDDVSTARLTGWLQHAIQGLPAGSVGERFIRVQPLRSSIEDNQSHPLLRLGAYGQLFPQASPQSLIGDRVGQGLVRDITCWGDGKINLRRASERVLERQCENILSQRQTQELLEARNNDPYLPRESLYQSISNLDRETQKRLDALLTDHSTVYGLWIIAQDSQRPWYNLLITVGGPVAMHDAQGVPPYQPAQQYEFSW